MFIPLVGWEQCERATWWEPCDPCVLSSLQEFVPYMKRILEPGCSYFPPSPPQSITYFLSFQIRQLVKVPELARETSTISLSETHSDTNIRKPTGQLCATTTNGQGMALSFVVIIITGEIQVVELPTHTYYFYSD